MKLCVDCGHVVKLTNKPTYGCGCAENGSTIDLVDGRRLYVDCNKARSYNGDYKCGHEGTLWKAK